MISDAIRMTPQDPRTVRAWTYPAEGSIPQQLAFLLNYAVLAPSGHNTQPWLFRIAGGEIELYVDRSRAVPELDPGDRELIMSCGAALFHLCVAMRHFGTEPVVRLFPDLDDPDLLAFIRLGEPLRPSLSDERLFEAIRRRRTHRAAFLNRAVPAMELEALTAAVAAEGARLHVVTDEGRKVHLAQLIEAGDQALRTDAGYRRTLARWIRPNGSPKRDGIPGYARGATDVRSYVDPWLIRLSPENAAQAHGLPRAEAAPALLVLSTERDTNPSLLAAGQALDRLLLTATAFGLDASFLNQPLKVEALRPHVADLIGGAWPQAVLRLGYGTPGPTTPRRTVDEVITRDPFG